MDFFLPPSSCENYKKKKANKKEMPSKPAWTILNAADKNKSYK